MTKNAKMPKNTTKLDFMTFGYFFLGGGKTAKHRKKEYKQKKKKKIAHTKTNAVDDDNDDVDYDAPAVCFCALSDSSAFIFPIVESLPFFFGLQAMAVSKAHCALIEKVGIYLFIYSLVYV